MMFQTLNGRAVKLKNPTRYLIKWNGKCRSKLQKKVKLLLYKYWFTDTVFEEMPVVGTRMTLDFYNANRKIALEVDGKQHDKYVEFFHKKNRQNFLSQIYRDDEKHIFCEKNGITLVRIKEGEKINEELLRELDLI